MSLIMLYSHEIRYQALYLLLKLHQLISEGGAWEQGYELTTIYKYYDRASYCLIPLNSSVRKKVVAFLSMTDLASCGVSVGS